MKQRESNHKLERWQLVQYYQQQPQYHHHHQQQQHQLQWTIRVMKLGHWFQMFIVLIVTLLVWESHYKATLAAEQLLQFKEEESRLLLHLQKIEQNSIQLHEHLRKRLAAVGILPVTSADFTTTTTTSSSSSSQTSEDDSLDGITTTTSTTTAAAAASGTTTTTSNTDESDVLQEQANQLKVMENQLAREVSVLQRRIQHEAMEHIVREYGEGPVKVLLDLEGIGTISVLLWRDAPHAAWTWLDQISRHVWDGTELTWKESHIIDGKPAKSDPLQRGHIEFVEHTQHGHEAWTVGLK